MTTEEDFQRALDADPTNGGLRMVFADYLDEQGDPRGPGYRALGAIAWAPRYSGSGPNWQVTFNLEGTSDLCREWFDLVNAPQCKMCRSIEHKDAPRPDLENAAALAFAKLPPEVAERILASVNNDSPAESAK